MCKEYEQFEIMHRFCPICDAEIHPGDPLHHCDPKKIKKIERMYAKQEDQEQDIAEPERCYGDKLQESEEIYDNENYYDLDEDEQ